MEDQVSGGMSVYLAAAVVWAVPFGIGCSEDTGYQGAAVALSRREASAL